MKFTFGKVEGMKWRLATIVLSLFTCVASIAFAQDQKEQVKTKLESFSKESGTVFLKGYSEIGSVSGLGSVAVKCIEFKNVKTGSRSYGIVIDVQESGRLERSNRSFIDYEEIQSLINGIDYISKTSSDSVSLSSFEAHYQTKGDFEVTVFSGENGDISSAIKSGEIGSATVYLPMPTLLQLRSLIAKAKQILDDIKNK